jgi:hypothetical protein
MKRSVVVVENGQLTEVIEFGVNILKLGLCIAPSVRIYIFGEVLKAEVSKQANQ